MCYNISSISTVKGVSSVGTLLVPDYEVQCLQNENVLHSLRDK